MVHTLQTSSEELLFISEEQVCSKCNFLFSVKLKLCSYFYHKTDFIYLYCMHNITCTRSICYMHAVCTSCLIKYLL